MGLTTAILWLLLAILAASADAAGCCKLCKKGSACGNSCIADGLTCHKESGCACDSRTCCKFCARGKACGDSCIAAEEKCTKASGCACDGASAKKRSSGKDWLDMLKEALKKGHLVRDAIESLGVKLEL
eukprot:gb/GFBE01045372.1/.p1 GENE.gb/GFBE01045372.1/~~gb/GFBE01045372.1/.p1  ORF type:complete len:129 (+),score=31.32 gb/GFBE01045372.1/:1-387(+)